MTAREFLGDRLPELLGRLGGLRVAVLGDYFLDRYLFVEPSLAEVSVETGLPAHQVVGVRNDPGAAGTVAGNLAALGVGSLHAVGLVGDDGHGIDLRRELKRRGVTDQLSSSADWLTPTYTKPITTARPAVEMERLDIRLRRDPSDADLAGVRDTLERLDLSLDAVMVVDQVSDPAGGVMTAAMREWLAGLAERWDDVLFFVDSRARIGEYRNVIVKANRAEAERATGERDPASMALALSARTGRPALVTCGPEGIMVAEAGRAELVPGQPVAGPVDVTGAGDSASAGFVLARLAGASLPEAAAFGCLVASVTVRKLGTTGTATPAELLAIA